MAYSLLHNFFLRFVGGFKTCKAIENNLKLSAKLSFNLLVLSSDTFFGETLLKALETLKQ